MLNSGSLLPFLPGPLEPRSPFARVLLPRTRITFVVIFAEGRCPLVLISYLGFNLLQQTI
jgi:hypothetical protein